MKATIVFHIVLAIVILAIVTLYGCSNTTSPNIQTVAISDSLQDNISLNIELNGITEDISSVYSYNNSNTGKTIYRIDTTPVVLSILQTSDSTEATTLLTNDSLIWQWKREHSNNDTSYAMIITFDNSHKGSISLTVVCKWSFMTGNPHGSLSGEQGWGSDSVTFTALPYVWDGGSLVVDVQGTTLLSHIAKTIHNRHIDGGDHFISYSYEDTLLSLENTVSDSLKCKLILK